MIMAAENLHNAINTVIFTLYYILRVECYASSAYVHIHTYVQQILNKTVLSILY